MVIAAYGSGKSLAAGIGAMIVKNDPDCRKAINPVLDRLRLVDAQLCDMSRERAAIGEGKIVVLSGHVPNLDVILAHLGGVNESPTGNIIDVAKTLRRGAANHLVIVWDEFGRHLEGIVAEGRARDLHALQRLAEWAARAKKPPVSLVLLMHQSLLEYADTLNQTSRNEWRKIEGRFRHIRFVEDSRELFALVAEFVSERRSKVGLTMPKAAWQRIVEGAIGARWFDGLESESEVEFLIRRVRPLTAGALQAIPRVVARAGQNERSLFAFIEDSKLDSVIGTLELYDAFAESMRSDVGIGGMHRRWLETENALSHATNIAEKEALTAACLLQLGVGGERRRLARRTLETAVASRGLGKRAAARAIEGLISRKLLIHRHRNDDVSIWHGADVDLASLIRDERDKLEHGFDVIDFLEANQPAPFVRPMRHNAERGTVRYLSGHYISARSFLAAKEPAAFTPDPGEWGRVYYVLPGSNELLIKVKRKLESGRARTDALLVFVVPDGPVAIKDAALEVAALSALRRDDVLLGEDPLVSQEIDELLSIARRHLGIVLHRLTTDRPKGTVWIQGDKQLPVSMERPAGIATSDLMDTFYAMTPRVVNDQMMRNRLSRQMRTALVRVILRIMEQGHIPHLGYEPNDKSAEASVFRTVLERTGLHRTIEDRGGFAEPCQLSDPGMREAWSVIVSFFREPEDRPKPLQELVARLQSRPIGLPLGVLPLLVMAGYRAFARVVSLRTDGIYVPDIMGFEASNMFLEPERHSIRVYQADSRNSHYLAELAYVFAHMRPKNGEELVRFGHDALARWKTALPRGAQRTTLVSDNAHRLLELVFEDEDPAKLFLESLPAALGKDGKEHTKLESTIESLESIRNEVDGFVEGYVNLAVDCVAETLTLDPYDDSLTGIADWVTCLDVEDLLLRKDIRLADKAVMRIALDTLNGRYSPQSLARALSSILLTHGIDQWQDETIHRFRMLLRECRQRIEDAALDIDRPSKSMAPIVRARIDVLCDMLEDMESSEHSLKAVDAA